MCIYLSIGVIHDCTTDADRVELKMCETDRSYYS
jgi:hypothetical protein